MRARLATSLLAALAGAATWALSAAAEIRTVNFDDLVGGTVVSTQYADRGAVFGSAGFPGTLPSQVSCANLAQPIVVASSDLPWSPPNAARGARCGSGEFAHTGVVVRLAKSRSVAIRAGVSTGPRDVRFEAFNAGGVRVAQRDATVSASAFTPLDLAAADGDIEWVAIYTANAGSTLVIDDLAFDVAPVTPPPTTTTAPTPPPAPPPTPSPVTPATPELAEVIAIREAAPFKASSAVVLLAEVRGPVERLEWQLPAGGRIVGRTLSGRLQHGVRLRPSPGRFTVGVRAVGPTGAGAVYTREFTAPRASTGANIERAAQQLRRVPAVVGVGDPQVLLGRSSACSPPTTMQSARLELTGCLAGADALAGIPAGEREVFKKLARQIGMPVGDADGLRAAAQLSDGYVARVPLTLPGNWPLVPRAGSSILVFPQFKGLGGSNAAVRIGGHAFTGRGGLIAELDPSRLALSLPALPRPASLSTIAGFKAVGDFTAQITGSEARVTAALRLPSFLKRAGVDIQSQVRLRATPDRLIVDDLVIGPIDVSVGALSVRQFRITYRSAANEWQGQGRACLVSGACLDMVPPNGQIKIRDGRLDFAGASVNFPRPGVPIFPGVNLERIGFGLGLNPTRITGNGRLSLGQVVVVDGRLFLAFPSSGTPFVLKRDEVGGGFPAHFYGPPHTRTTVGMSADMLVRLPAIGEVRLGNGHLLYEYPGYVAFGGSFDTRFGAVIRIKGGVAGELNTGAGLFNLHGRVEACLEIVRQVCGGAIGNVSRGKNGTGGAGACIRLGPVQVGGGVQWQRVSRPFIWPIDGCKWSRFTADVSARAAQTSPGGPHVARVRRGDRSRAVQLDGSGAAPLVRVTSPSGTTVESDPGSGLTTSSDGAIRIIRVEGESANFTVVGLQDPRPGSYRIDALPSSPAITRVSQATDPADAQATVSVRGSGMRRQIVYSVRRRPAQRVTFVDVAADGASKRLGTVVGGGRGRLRFSTAPGSGAHTIKARFELAGLPAEELEVARFRPPSPRLGQPARVRVRRSGTKLRITWTRVAGAARYEIAVTLRSGRQRVATTTKRSLVLTAIPRSARGSVSVRAVADLRQGSPRKLALTG